jgi:hypothetical protein
VGGTSLGVGANGSRAVETGWRTSDYSCDRQTLACTRTGWLYGAGGGVSRVFAEPSYQAQAGLKLSGRGVPDVAAVGDPQTGYLVGQTQTFPDGVYYDEYRLGGTSLSSPLFAGIVALSQQQAGRSFGFANPPVLRERQEVLRRHVGQDGRRPAQLREQRRRERRHRRRAAHVRRLLGVTDPAHEPRLGQRDRSRHAERAAAAVIDSGEEGEPSIAPPPARGATASRYPFSRAVVVACYAFPYGA